MKLIPFLCLAAALALLTAPASAGTFTDSLDGKLVRLVDGKVKKVPKGHLAQKKVIALYYAAQWCPPCRAFTPELVKEYAKLAAEHPEFELILVSQDNNEKAIEEYMAESSINFPALQFDAIASNPTVSKMASSGIPHLVVVDADGNEMLGKGEKDWVHPTTILTRLQKLLASGKTS
jgi:thiol-disulfide isomerase/thioredoxin